MSAPSIFVCVLATFFSLFFAVLELLVLLFTLSPELELITPYFLGFGGVAFLISAFLGS